MSTTYDAFFSYSGRQRDTATAIADGLRKLCLRPFLDAWYLAPGQPWRPRLDEILASSAAVVVCVGADGLGAWQQRELDVALQRQTLQSDFPVIPVVLPGCEPPLGFLRQQTWVGLRDQDVDWAIDPLARATQGNKRHRRYRV